MIWLLANWRLVAVVLLVAAIGVQTIRLQEVEAEYDHFKLEAAAASREAKAKAEAINAHNELIQEELEHDIHEAHEARALERKERADRFSSLYGKYMGLLNADPGGGRMPEAGSGAAEPLQTGLNVCFDRTRLVDGVRQSLGALYSEVEQLVRSGEDGVDDGVHWGRWARLTGVCAETKRSP